MKRIRWGVVPVMLVLAGCATMDIHSDFDCKADFSKLKTFSWVPDMKQESQDPRIANVVTDAKIRSVVEKVLATKGYQKSDVGQSDFLVAYQAAIEKKIDTRMTRFPYETPSTRDIASGNFAQDLTWAYGGSQTFLSQYEEGTLILDIVDPQKKKLMWRGTAKATLSEGRDSAKKEARLNEGVQKIFETFPPK
ncbi:MAG: hypothetical protein A2351_07475 [Omnitrophica bacterium RIFOXYB12_FULL_50_7]|nr:MAG: hypothetical protein A2351_07475 [Omnitrophica bacterium RIFOXYB12_FULL_50_7]